MAFIRKSQHEDFTVLMPILGWKPNSQSTSWCLEWSLAIVMPPLIFTHGFWFNTEVYIKYLGEVVLPKIEGVANRRPFVSQHNILRILRSSSITWASPSDCLASYQDTRWEVLTLCRDAVGIFYSIQHTRWGSHTPMQKCSRYILQPQLTGLSRTLGGEVLHLCRDAVGVFCSPSRLGHFK